MNGAITKDFFPSVEERLAAILNLSLKLKKKNMTGHGNILSHLHRLEM